MKRNLLLTTLLLLVSAIGMAQATTWPITLTTADGLPGKKEPQNYIYETELFKFDEAISTLRYTVVSTNTVDALTSNSHDGLSANYGPGFPFFALGELTIIDANGNPIEYIATTNALAQGDGSLANLNDGKYNTHFHSVYGNVGPCPQEYHYIDLEFAQPISEFKIKTVSRANYTKNMPTYVGLTPGTEYLPYPEQEFTIGTQVTSVEELGEGGLFLIEANTEEYEYSDTRVIPGGGYLHSPYGAHTTANAASLVYFIPTEKDNTYKVAWLNNGHYINDMVTHSRWAWLQWTDKEDEAAEITFTPSDEAEGDFCLTNINKEDSCERIIYFDAIGKAFYCTYDYFEELSSPYKTNFTIWKANVNANGMKFMLEEAVNEAKLRLSETPYDENEECGGYKELAAALANAEEILADNNATAVQVINSRYSIYEALPEFVASSIYQYVDSIAYIIENIENGDIEISEADNFRNGTYPEGSDEFLRNAADEAMIAMDSYTCIADVDAALDNIKAAIATFWASEISGVMSLPIRVGQAKDGLPGVNTNSVWRWESPTYYLTEEIEQLRFTVFKTKAGRCYGDKPFVCINEFELYDISGEKIELTENSFVTNSVAPSDGQGIAGLVDGNTGNGYHYHSAWGDGFGYDGSEYVYLDITLPEPISGFKYIQYGRGNGYDDVPTDFVFGHYGKTVEPTTVGYPDEFNAILGEKVTDISQITDDGIYAIAGLISCDPVNHFENDLREPHYYSAGNAYDGFNSLCAFNIAKTEDGKFTIQSLADGSYWSGQVDEDGWGAGATTLYKSSAAKVSIVPNNNDGLPNSFVIYMYNDSVLREGEPHPYIVFQDWGDNIGTYSVKDLKDNDKDGEGEWYIYKMTMDTPYYFWLKNLVSAAESMGFVCSNDPGFYKELGTFPEALAAAQAAVESKDDEACKALIAGLNDAIANLNSVSPNPIVEGTYVLESADDKFFELQGVNKALYVYPNNDDAMVTSEQKLFWGDAPDGGYKNASAVYHFQLESAKESDKVQQWIANNTITLEQANDAYYIKNVYYNVYIGAQDGMSKRMGTTTEPEAVYILRQQLPGKFDIWNPTNSAWSLHMESHGEGAGANGGLVYWYGTAGASQWRLRKIDSTTPRIATITLDGENGTLTGAGTYTIGTEAKITATPNTGYAFAGWYLDGVLLSNKTEYSFTVEKSLNIIAKFYKQATIGYTMNVKDLRCAPGSKLVIPVNMKNKTGITAFQFDLYLPEGMTIAEEDGEPMIELDAARKTSSHSVSSSQLADGATRIVAYSSGNKLFANNDGTVVNITINVPSNMELKDYTLTLKEIILADATENEYYTDIQTSKITVANIMGDANMDEKVNISDVVAVVNYILERNPAKFDFAAADVSGDGNIRMGDVVGIVNIILGKTSTEYTRNAKPGIRTMSSETLTAADVKSTGEATIPLSLNNSTSYTSFQMDVTIPEGTTFAGAALSERATGSHSIAWSNIGENKVRIVAYSIANSNFAGNAGELLNITIDAEDAVNGTLEVDNVVMADAEGNETAIGGCGSTIDINGTTGITGTQADGIKIYTSEGALVVESSVETTLPLYSTDGRLVERLQIASGKNIFNTLEKGLYIVNGKKVTIK
ncbi:MAG: hypothetical protein IJB77_07415 [Bacteroidaceae bacterium]|nr:hypothetical protein [Bacteroidaceae bacterium]